MDATLRRPDLGRLDGLPEAAGRAFALELFRRGSRARRFELKAKEAFEQKRIRIPMYLSVGQEFNAAALSLALEGFQVFPQHRGHSVYLCFGGPGARLRDELLGLPSGLAGGMAGSNAIHCPEKGIWGHSGLLGEQVPIAVGAALGNGRPTLALLGDAAAGEDYFYPSLGFAACHKLPILFVCEDNGLSILTPVETRRRWSVPRVAEGFGIPAVDIADDPWLIAHHARALSKSLPALINIRTVRNLWHAGAGCDGPPEWDRYALIQETLAGLGLAREAEVIVRENEAEMDGLWRPPQKP